MPTPLVFSIKISNINKQTIYTYIYKCATLLRPNDTHMKF